jgi:hypothetical protein
MKKTIWAILGIMLVLILSGCSGDPTDVAVKMDVPLKVANSEEFIIAVTVKNTASNEQKLVSLDIGDKYLKGIAIIKAEPDYSESFHVPIDNTVSYKFNIPIKSGKEITVNLYAKALKYGDFNSEIDFCINKDDSFLTKIIRTVVE